MFWQVVISKGKVTVAPYENLMTYDHIFYCWLFVLLLSKGIYLPSGNQVILLQARHPMVSNYHPDTTR